jgi:hypothetical protein
VPRHRYLGQKEPGGFLASIDQLQSQSLILITQGKIKMPFSLLDLIEASTIGNFTKIREILLRPEGKAFLNCIHNDSTALTAATQGGGIQK